MLDPGVTRALVVVHERAKPAADALVFPSPDGVEFEGDRLAEVLRARLWQAKVHRTEHHTAGENRGRLRVHDLRGTFVTLNLAVGKSETWVADRGPHVERHDQPLPAPRGRRRS